MAGKMMQLTDLMAANGQYTFRFQSDGKFKPDPEDLRYRIATSNLPVTDVNATYEGGLGGFFGGTAVISFTWMQTGWTVKQVAENMEAALAKGLLGHFTYVAGSGGTEVDSTGLFGKLSDVKAGSILAIVIAALVVIALASGFGRGLAAKV